MAYIHAFGTDYYLDEEAWTRQVVEGALNGPPWRVEEVIAIQQQMRGLDNLLLEYMQRTATPNPLDTLRKHLDEMIARGEE